MQEQLSSSFGSAWREPQVCAASANAAFKEEMQARLGLIL